MSKQLHCRNIDKQITEEWLNGATTEQLRVKYGYKTRKSITDKLKKNGINDVDFKAKKQQKKTWNLSLDHIHEFEAYFLGLMATDGYVQSKSNQFGIDLTDEDCIKYISTVTNKKYSTYIKQDYKNNGVSQIGFHTVQTKRPVHRIVFNDEILYNQLLNRGITPKKSSTIQKVFFSQEEERYIPYFIRGVIDGDGTIGHTSGGTLYFKIVSHSESFTNWIVSILETKMYMDNIHVYYKQEQDMYEIYSSDSANIEKLYVLSYLSPMGMSRKRNKLIEGRSETIIRTSNEECIVQTTTD